MRTATALVERAIQTVKGLLLATLDDNQSLESVCRTLWVMRFTTHTARKRTPFQMHYSSKTGPVMTNIFKTKPTLIKLG